MTIQTDTIEEPAHITVISLIGEMDLYSSNQLKDAVVNLWDEGHGRVIIDLSDLSYVDSSGVGVLLYVYSGSQKRGHEVYFAGAHGPVSRVLELTKLDGFLPLDPDIETAVRRFSAAEPEEEPKEAPIKQLLVNTESPLFDTKDMYHKSFNIDLGHVRRLANLIAQRAPSHLRDINILEQQISELIKNAVKHGNGNDKTKAVHIWFEFTDESARLIVQDEGTGFEELERWNEFYRKKIECYRNQDFEGMTKYLMFRTDKSSEHDGGNAMMAAVEYWDQGVVFNEERNAVAVMRSFAKDQPSL